MDRDTEAFFQKQISHSPLQPHTHTHTHKLICPKTTNAHYYVATVLHILCSFLIIFNDYLIMMSHISDSIISVYK